jgi:NADH pyrophosphatase NudC (nudix superfamily)
MRPVGGDVSLHDHEFDEVRWFQLEEGLELMTHATERSVVEEAAARIAVRAARSALPAEAARGEASS